MLKFLDQIFFLYDFMYSRGTQIYLYLYLYLYLYIYLFVCLSIYLI